MKTPLFVLQYDNNCLPNTCEIAATLEIDATHATVEITADTSGWAAIGFSKDNKMVFMVLLGSYRCVCYFHLIQERVHKLL